MKRWAFTPIVSPFDVVVGVVFVLVSRHTTSPAIGLVELVCAMALWHLGARALRKVKP